MASSIYEDYRDLELKYANELDYLSDKNKDPLIKVILKNECRRL